MGSSRSHHHCELIPSLIRKSTRSSWELWKTQSRVRGSEVSLVLIKWLSAVYKDKEEKWKPTMLDSLIYSFLMTIKPITVLIREQSRFLRSMVKLLFFFSLNSTMVDTVLWDEWSHSESKQPYQLRNTVTEDVPRRRRLTLLFGKTDLLERAGCCSRYIPCHCAEESIARNWKMLFHKTD